MPHGESKKEKNENKIVEKRVEETGPAITGVYDYFRNLFARLKQQNFYRDFFKSKNPQPTTMFLPIEEKIKGLFDKIYKIVEDFLEHEMKGLKNHTEEDLDKIKKILTEYKSTIVKIFEDHSKSTDEVKEKLQKRVVTAEEFDEFIKISEGKLNELKKITENLTEFLVLPELDSFKQNLKNTLNQDNEGIMSARRQLVHSLKDSLVQKPVPPKLPLSEIKIPDMQSKKSTSTSQEEKFVPKSIISPEIRNKLRKFSFTKHFNSETATGRANVAKLTIAGIVLGLLYWRRKRSQAQQ
ncbi:GRIP and coiled-coil domain-containing protein 2-like [Diachasmimorpha longicaudata]|uniref:GRIP and coiled-coil domain-containing protein 2-like n=1 Tax=Diachasmimorpha longicaudata TaxID=58733 RepID=UPI0030B8D18F